MPKTNLILELEVTQEYTGEAIQLCHLVPQWKTYLNFDTYANGQGSYVKKIVSGAVNNYTLSGIAGVSNIGNNRNWTGLIFAAANTYGLGRLAWNPDFTAEDIANEWIIMTFGDDPQVVSTISQMLLNSWAITESYMAPLGVGMLCDDAHYNPNPAGRTDATNATKTRVGYDRTKASGSGFTNQYHAPVSNTFESLNTCPEELLLFFHNLPYTYILPSENRSIIQHIYKTHIDGVNQVRDQLLGKFKELEGKIDTERFTGMVAKLEQNVHDAGVWRDSINDYFSKLSGIPIPPR